MSPVHSPQLDLLLVDVVERLAAEFPDLPIAMVSRCVQAVRAMAQPVAPADVPSLAKRVENAARDDVRRIAVAICGPTLLAGAR